MDYFPEPDYQINPHAVKTQWLWVTHSFLNAVTHSTISSFFVLTLSKTMDGHGSGEGSYRTRPVANSLHHTHKQAVCLEVWGMNGHCTERRGQSPSLGRCKLATFRPGQASLRSCIYCSKPPFNLDNWVQQWFNYWSIPWVLRPWWHRQFPRGFSNAQPFLKLPKNVISLLLVFHRPLSAMWAISLPSIL